MSASLVGSEMCIRDSHTSAKSTTSSTTTNYTRPPRPVFIANGLQAPPRPVSYTHLTLPTICSV
eukprot:11802600-Alexandrium_andersonii.AAC.1